MEKLAARAWKREIGNLSEAQRKKLEDRNILNYDRERRGLNRGTDNILSKYKAEKLTASQFADRYKKAFGDIPGTRESLSNIKRGTFLAHHDLGDGPAVLFSGNAVDGKNVSSLLGEETAHNIRKLPDKEKAYVRALAKRHEADEIRYGRINMKNKRLSVPMPGEKKGVPVTHYSSHISPRVLLSESANSAVAPKNVNIFNKLLRNKIGESKALRDSSKLLGHNFEYGESGMVNNKFGRKLDRILAKVWKRAHLR